MTYIYDLNDHLPSKDLRSCYYNFDLEVRPCAVVETPEEDMTDEFVKQLAAETEVIKERLIKLFPRWFTPLTSTHAVSGCLTLHTKWITADWLLLHRKEIYELLEFLKDESYVTSLADDLVVRIHKAVFGYAADQVCALMGEFIDTAWDELVVFARRRDFRCCRRPNLPYSLAKTNDRETVAAILYELGSHPAAISFSQREAELWLWQSTLDITTLMATLELTTNLTEWARDAAQFGLRKTKYNLRYLANIKLCPDLAAYLDNSRFDCCPSLKKRRAVG
jgi:hypothetical protein